MGRNGRIALSLLIALFLAVPQMGGGCGGEEHIVLIPLQEPAGFSILFPSVETEVPATPPRPPAASPSSVRGLEAVTLAPRERRLLLEHGFVLTPAADESLTRIYAESPSPPLVTIDLLMSVFLQLCRKAVLQMARGTLYDDLLQLSGALVGKSSDLAVRGGAKTAEAARANQAFFGVAARILDPGCSLPAEVEETVAREVRLVEEAEAVEISPLFGYRHDYRSFRPEGVLAGDERSTRFFRAVAWYGSMVMRLRPDGEGAMAKVGRRETRQAALAICALHSGRVGEEAALSVWERLWQTCRFFLSCTGGLSVYDYTRAMREVLGEHFPLRVLEDDGKVDALAQRLLGLEEERALLNLPAREAGGSPAGLRFLGERLSPDRLIMRFLTDPMVPGRKMACGLDLPGALGSQRAWSIMETLYEADEYPEMEMKMELLRRWLASRASAMAAKDLSWGLMEIFRLMLTENADGLPIFMRTTAWQDRCLSALLGAWVSWKGAGEEENPAERSGALPGSEEARPNGAVLTRSEGIPGYVEPNPLALARLTAWVEMTARGLRERDFLDERTDRCFRTLQALLGAMRVAAEKELSDSPFGEEEAAAFRDLVELMRSLGAEKAEPLLLDWWEDEGEGTVLQAATGRPMICHLIVCHRGNHYYVRGGCLSYYEFGRPRDVKMDARAWSRLLEEGEAPTPPPWTASFL